MARCGWHGFEGYRTAWGGPTLAGVWAVYAGLVLLVTVPVLLWTLWGLARLRGRVLGGAVTR
ncbi:hypothetical protein [Actinoplanes sp. NBRC 101535]|uniref:hypothetical protein n=1 Tax=Actinoplanes sp. NBRC 101535 TaxID=3032196 RepID=UPI0024A46562|nr:hypothetical protein [Actinoplanes sp. NBRC 101535]GLY07889.1 hypothetical protein Acsp01_82680 [Actinoplanes sp. NBRC 101535]